MIDAIQLESVNVGSAESISHNDETHHSGICKTPVAGPVHIGEFGVRNDVIVDSRHHGGIDQAVYAYSADDYDWWADQTDRDYPPGLFGENLTIRGLPTDVNVGDRLLIGELVLEATSPRIPCSTFAARMKDSGFGMTFRKAERPGIYFRVLNSGEVCAGDSVTFVADDAGSVSILELFRFNFALRRDIDEMHRFLQAPVATRFRDKIESRLALAEQSTN